MEKDYSIYENKKLNYIFGKKDHEAVIAGCDFYIGITIMSVDKKTYLTCLSGPSSPKNKHTWYGKMEEYKAEFLFLIEKIKTGVLDNEEWTNWITKNSSIKSKYGASMETCPFSV